MKKHKGAYDSGMRGAEKAKVTEEAEHPPEPELKQANDSGMRGAEKPALKKVEPSLAPADGQQQAQQVAQGLQPGTGTEAMAQAEMPPMIDAGDHYQIPKAHLIDGGDHYKLMKRHSAAQPGGTG